MARLAGTILRAAGRAMAGFVVVAILLGRYQCEPPGDPRPGSRVPAPPRYHGITRRWFTRDWSTPRFLDTETGLVMPGSISGVDRVDPLGCSPWRDGSGQYHLIIRYKDTAGDPGSHLGRGFILARCAYPDGRVLGRVAFDRVPLMGACWFPDRSDRILLAAGDGQLYSCDFPDGERIRMPTPRPRPIPWGCDPPGRIGVYLADPCWPAAPALGGRIFVAMTAWDDASQAERGQHLWWLQLDPDGTEIVAAGRAIARDDDGSAADRDVERLPAVGATRDGRMLLAYLARRRGRKTWELWVTPIAADGADRAPWALSPGRKLVEECLAMAPAFSPDGRWVYAALPDERDGVRMERFEIALPAGDPPRDAIGE
jgi:hypothetical protein